MGSGYRDRMGAHDGNPPARRPSLGGAADLAGWVAGLAVDEAARSRARAYWLQRQAGEEGTFAGVLADLAERGRGVVVHLRNGRRHHGRAVLIGADFVAVRTEQHRDVLLALGAVASVRTRAGDPPTLGDRPVVADLQLVEALAVLAEDRTRVIVRGDDAADAVHGELRGVGRDVATVRLDGAGGTAYVALASVVEVSVPESG
jgi:hypothetical protein